MAAVYNADVNPKVIEPLANPTSVSAKITAGVFGLNTKSMVSLISRVITGEAHPKETRLLIDRAMHLNKSKILTGLKLVATELVAFFEMVIRIVALVISTIFVFGVASKQIRKEQIEGIKDCAKIMGVMFRKPLIGDLPPSKVARQAVKIAEARDQEYSICNAELYLKAAKLLIDNGCKQARITDEDSEIDVLDDGSLVMTVDRSDSKYENAKVDEEGFILENGEQLKEKALYFKDSDVRLTTLRKKLSALEEAVIEQVEESGRGEDKESVRTLPLQPSPPSAAAPFDSSEEEGASSPSTGPEEREFASRDSKDNDPPRSLSAQDKDGGIGDNLQVDYSVTLRPGMCALVEKTKDGRTYHNLNIHPGHIAQVLGEDTPINRHTGMLARVRHSRALLGDDNQPKTNLTIQLTDSSGRVQIMEVNKIIFTKRDL